MAELLRRFTNRVRLYIGITHVDEIARRYFVVNAFDGSMTTLGIILGAWTLRIENPNLIIITGLGACLAMGVSGFFGAYMSERAERKGRLKEMEESLLSNLNNSIHEGASEFVPVFAALINGLSPALTALISLIPFFLTLFGALAISDAYLAYFALTFAMLFSLGIYLGKIAKEKAWLYGIQMLAAGVTISLIISLLGGFAA